VASEEYEKAHRDIKDNAWFVAYAPCEKPEIAVSVLWENVGVQGAHAAPTARDIIKAYFDKKQRLAEVEAAKEKLNPSTALVSAILPVIRNAPSANPPPEVH
jgi:penicillin-binding protein 2